MSDINDLLLQIQPHVLNWIGRAGCSTFPTAPVVGQWVFRSDLGRFYFWSGTAWIDIVSNAAVIGGYLPLIGGTLSGTLALAPGLSTMQLLLHPTFAVTEGGVTYNAGFFKNSAGEPVFTMIRSAAGTTMLGAGVNGDTERRFAIGVGGEMTWGSGAATRDVTLQRTAASLLRLYAGLIVDNQVSIGMTGTTAKLNITQATNTESSGIIITGAGVARTFRMWVDGSNVCRIDSGSGGGGDLAINTTGVGKVGLGTTSPAARLDVVGKADVVQLKVTAHSTQTNDLVQLGDGTNYLAVEKDGTLRLAGTATAFDDIQFPVGSGRVSSSNAPNWETFTPNTSEYAFTVNDFIDVQASEPKHGWKEGSIADVHVHVTLKTAQNSGANRYAKYTVWVAMADVLGVWTETAFTAELTIATGSAALKHYLLDLGDATMTGYHVGMQLKARVKRIAATGGTEYADRTFITQVGMHMEHDKIGSRTEYAA